MTTPVELTRTISWGDPLPTAAGMAGRTGLEFLGAIRVGAGVVTATAAVGHLGRRTALARADLRDGSGRLLATATSTCLLLTPAG